MASCAFSEIFIKMLEFYIGLLPIILLIYEIIIDFPNVYNIKNRIINLKQRLELVNDPAQIAKIERNLKCLEMSKESIIYYYGLDVIV